jgi:hypothetical protein
VTKSAAISESQMRSRVGTLLLADAFAVLVGTVGAFTFRTAVRSYDSVAPSHLAALILPALPFALAACLLSLLSAGYYGPRRADLGPVDVAASLAWAASLLAFIAFYWAKGPEAPLLVLAAGYAFILAAVLSARAFVDRRESANST